MNVEITTHFFQPLVLETDRVKLVPLAPVHKQELIHAVQDGQLDQLWFTSAPSNETVDRYIEKALLDLENDSGLAFVVIDKYSGSVIGSTRYTNATPQHRRVEIGYTWYAKRFQRTHVNSECKLLLLTHAFETLKCIAVEFRTHWYNQESRRAIERLGAKQDGVLRNHLIMPDGTIRDTVVFSILEHEWPVCKRALQFKLQSNQS